MELPNRPYHDKCFQLFQSKLHEFTVRPNPRPEWKPRNFVLFAKFSEWLNAFADKNSQDSNAAILLDAVYKEWHQPDLPIKIGAVTERCPFTFCILIELRLGELLYCFDRCGITDERLPMKLTNLEENIVDALRHYGLSLNDAVAQAPDLAKRFDKEQWKYFAVRFRDQKRVNWESRRIFPFIDRKLITDKGGFADVFEVAIPGRFLDEALKKRSPAPISHPQFPQLGPVYRFALKVFEDGHLHLFLQETSAYQTLGRHNGMVKYLGDYSHVVENDGASHNILLEYAENDLAEYFFRSPPILKEHIDSFWKNLLRTASAIQDLHEFETQRLKSGKSTKYKGWHADIKPDNILLVRGEFKLADPGFARFEQLQEDNKKAKGLGIEIHGGTKTYGAPERFSGDVHNPDHAKSDMWSLGCVFSEAATWVVLGRTGVRQFSMIRQSAISSVVADFVASGETLAKSPLKRLQGSDCFHDGQRVLTEVTEWHKLLKSVLRPTDCMTRRILDMIDKYLFAESQHRADAKTICKWWEEQSAVNVVLTAPVSVPRSIQDILDLAIKQEAEEVSQQFQSLGNDNIESRRAAKSSNSFLQIPGLNRSTNVASLTHKPPRPGQPEYLDSQDNTSSSLPPCTPSPGHQPQFPGHEYVGNGVSTRSTHHNSISSLGGPITPSQSKEEPKITVFDAYYQDLTEKDKHKHKFKWLSKAESGRKDDRLQKAIVDRDLILVTKTWNIDPDGVELLFTHGPVKVKGERKKKRDLEEKKRVLDEFKTAMNHIEARPTTSRTDMSVKLRDILFRWIKDFERALRHGIDKSSLTVIVLTDGKWRGMETRPLEVDKMIIEFNEQLRKAAGFFQRKRPVSISFISFGRDPDAIYRLRRLDNDLGVEGVPDIVDTEPSDGDIYQMLLGSISDDHDHRNDPINQASPPLDGTSYPLSSPVSQSLTDSSHRPPSTHKHSMSKGEESITATRAPVVPFGVMAPTVMRTLHE